MVCQQQLQLIHREKKTSATTSKSKLQCVKTTLLICTILELFNILSFPLRYENQREKINTIPQLEQFSSQKYNKNPIEVENSKLGTKDWILTSPALDREIEGYASHTSINAGESILLFYNTKSEEVRIDIFRTGWYQGLGGRKITKSVIVPGIAQYIPRPGRFRQVECDWKDPYVLQTSNEWVTGVYLIRMTELQNNKQSYAIFVIRDDSRKADILFQLPVYTYQAYNCWGGMSLYGWGSSGADSLPWGYYSSARIPGWKASFLRPYARSNNDIAAYGMGAGEYLTNVQPIHHYPISSSAGWNYNMVRWLERNHIDVSYITNVDVHIQRALPLPKLFLTQGHDEYWTWEMRDYVENLRDEGVNLLFLSSNTAFWQIRVENSNNKNKIDVHRTKLNATKTLPPLEPTSIVCYRWPGVDPNKEKQNKTIRWRLLNRPEVDMVGVQYRIGGDPFDEDLIVYNASHWIFDKTNITKKGDVLPGLLGYEVDGMHSDRTNQGYSIQKLFETPVTSRAAADILCHGTIYHTLKSFVFASGSMQWSWGLDDFNVYQKVRSSRLNRNVHIITWNLLKAAGIQPK